jgi:hypothetical protein
VKDGLSQNQQHTNDYFMETYNKAAINVPQQYLVLVNQVFEIEKKISLLVEENSIIRNLNKLKELIENELFKGVGIIGLSYYNPMGENYNETRTDCEASISGVGSDNLVIVEVIKPIIYLSFYENHMNVKKIIQKAVVVVESQPKN